MLLTKRPPSIPNRGEYARKGRIRQRNEDHKAVTNSRSAVVTMVPKPTRSEVRLSPRGCCGARTEGASPRTDAQRCEGQPGPGHCSWTGATTALSRSFVSACLARARKYCQGLGRATLLMAPINCLAWDREAYPIPRNPKRGCQTVPLKDELGFMLTAHWLRGVAEAAVPVLKARR